MQVNNEEYIALLKIKGLAQAAIRVYAPTASDGLKHLFGAIQEDINRYETLHGVGNSGATAVDYCDQLKRENANLKAENRRLRSIILTIFVLECNLHKLKGHECFAKHWALSLLDRVKRMKKEGV